MVLALLFPFDGWNFFVQCVFNPFSIYSKGNDCGHLEHDSRLCISTLNQQEIICDGCTVIFFYFCVSFRLVYTCRWMRLKISSIIIIIRNNSNQSPACYMFTTLFRYVSVAECGVCYLFLFQFFSFFFFAHKVLKLTCTHTIHREFFSRRCSAFDCLWSRVAGEKYLNNKRMWICASG